MWFVGSSVGKHMSCSRFSMLVFVRVYCAYISVLRWHFGTKDVSGNCLSPTHPPGAKKALVAPRFGTLRDTKSTSLTKRFVATLAPASLHTRVSALPTANPLLLFFAKRRKKDVSKSSHTPQRNHLSVHALLGPTAEDWRLPSRFGPGQLADKLCGFVRPSASHFGAQDNQSGAVVADGLPLFGCLFVCSARRRRTHQGSG